MANNFVPPCFLAKARSEAPLVFARRVSSIKHPASSIEHRESSIQHRAAIVLLIILALIVLSIVRYFWVDAANDHYDTLISDYIREMKDYEAEDQSRLKKQLLEGGIFIKMHRWDRESFVKDKELYNEMVKAYDRQEARREEREGGLIDAVINL